MSTPAPAVRKPRRQSVLAVLRREEIAEHLVRLTVGGDGFEELEFKDATDQYVKILFADPALGLTPPYDLDAIREEHGPAAVPVRRTYTVRAVRPEARELDLDFVTHGEAGLAAPWAESVEPGAPICFSGPGGNYAPRAGAWQLLAGDESALPAIAAALEAMGPQERGVALIEVESAAGQVDIVAPRGVEVRWLHRGAPWTPQSSLLEGAVRSLELPAVEDIQAFVHGERETMKSLRGHLVEERGLTRAQLSLSAYWAYGRVEDQFQAEKRTPIGKIFPEDA